MAESKKVTYIQTNAHAMVAGSAPLAPGDRVLVDEDNEAHKELLTLINAEDPSVEHLSVVEVDPKAEKKAAEEREEQLEEARKIAAEARQEQARADQEHLDEVEEAAEGVSPHSDPTDFPPQDEEAQRLAKESGAGQRASTQEDVVEEDKKSTGRKRSSRSGSKEDGE